MKRRAFLTATAASLIGISGCHRSRDYDQFFVTVWYDNRAAGEAAELHLERAIQPHRDIEITLAESEFDSIESFLDQTAFTHNDMDMYIREGLTKAPGAYSEQAYTWEGKLAEIDVWKRQSSGRRGRTVDALLHEAAHVLAGAEHCDGGMIDGAHTPMFTYCADGGPFHHLYHPRVQQKIAP